MQSFKPRRGDLAIRKYREHFLLEQVCALGRAEPVALFLSVAMARQIACDMARTNRGVAWQLDRNRQWKQIWSVPPTPAA